MTYKLYIDDIRNPPDASWVVARSMAAAQEYIAAYGFPYYISFDHDLGMTLRARDDGAIVLVADEEDMEAPTGYDFAKWLCDRDQESPWMKNLAFRWNVHSANPVGAANIRAYLTWYTERFVR